MKTNESGIIPLEYNCVVLPIEVEEKTAGGLYIPQDTQDREQHAEQRGIFVAASPLAFKFDEEMVAPEVGDTVVFVRYSGVLTEGEDGKKYRVLKDKDVMAVVKK